MKSLRIRSISLCGIKTKIDAMTQVIVGNKHFDQQKDTFYEMKTNVIPDFLSSSRKNNKAKYIVK